MGHVPRLLVALCLFDHLIDCAKEMKWVVEIGSLAAAIERAKAAAMLLF